MIKKQKEVSAMGKKTTMFQRIIEVIDRKNFISLVDKHDADRYVKQFDAWSHCLTMIYSQITAQKSLRGLQMNFGHAIQKEKLNNVAKPKRSTLSEANCRRPAEFFQDICITLIQKLQGIGKHKKETTESLQLIDATPIQLKGRGMEWVERSSRIEGLKGHFVYDTAEDAPVFFSITSAKVNDIVEGQKLKLKANQTYVFDRAYYDFNWWNSITEVGSIFVSRSKSTLAYKTVKRNASTVDSIATDHIIKLTSKKAYKYKGELRLIKAKVEIRGKKKSISIITNDFKSSASKIAGIYKKRWDIELFFKWIKQNLKIKKFFSQNENAIRVQIITAIIVYLLIRLMQVRTRSKTSMRGLALFLGNHLFSKVKYNYGNHSKKISLPKSLISTQVGTT